MFNTWDKLDDKIDKLISMMSKLTAQGNSQNRPFKPKIYKGKGEDKLGIIIIKIDTKVDVDQTVEMGECHIEAELSRATIIEKGHSMVKITEVISEEEILEKCKITEVKILEEDIEVASGMIIWQR